MSNGFKIALVIVAILGGLALYELIDGPDHGRKIKIPDGPAPKHPRPVAAAPVEPAANPAPEAAPAPASAPAAPASDPANP